MVQAQAGPQTERLILNRMEPFLFADPPDMNLLRVKGQRNNLRDFIFKHII